MADLTDPEAQDIISQVLVKLKEIEKEVAHLHSATANIDDFQSELEDLKNTVELMDFSFDDQSDRVNLQENLLSGFVTEQIRRDFPFDAEDIEVKHRYAAAHFYISINSEVNTSLRKEIEALMRGLLKNFFLEAVLIAPPIRGSLLQKMWVRTKDALNGKEAQENFEKGKRALELALIDKAQSEANRNNAEAIQKLSDAIGMNGNAVIGNLVIEKRTNSNGEIETISREMTQEQLARYHEQLNTNSRYKILEALATPRYDEPRLNLPDQSD